MAERASAQSSRADEGTAPQLPPDTTERVVSALLGAVARGAGIVVLDGPEGAGRSQILRVLAARLPPEFDPILADAEGLAADATPDAFARRILDALGAPASEAAQPDALRHAQRLRARGRSLVLLVDAGENLGDEAIRWLGGLAEPPQPLARVVLAARSYTSFLDALAGGGLCVDLVRLDPQATGRAPRAGTDATAAPRAPRPAPPLPFVCVPAPVPRAQPLPSAAPLPLPFTLLPAEPRGAPAEEAVAPSSDGSTAAPGLDAPPTSPARPTLWSVEDLLDDADYPVPPAAPRAPDVDDGGPAARAVEPPPTAAAGAVQRVAPPARSAPTAVVAATAPRRRTATRAGALAIAVAAALALGWWAISGFRREVPSSPAPGGAPSPREAVDPRDAPVSDPTDEGAATPEDDPSTAAALVTDLRQAIDLISRGAAHGDADAATSGAPGR